MKSYEEIMEILEAYDLTKSYRGAGELAGCSHHTVEHAVWLRDSGQLGEPRELQRPKLIDPFLDKVEEWVDRSRGKVRADVVPTSWRRWGSMGPSERCAARWPR